MSSRRPKVRRLRQWTWAGVVSEKAERCDAPLQPNASGFRHARVESGVKICNRYAKYSVGDRTMCRKHAALFVLDELDPETP